jgi:hypothetical protein
MIRSGRNVVALTDGAHHTVDEALDAASAFLGNGYLEKAGGRFVSADGLRQVRLGDSDILGRHAGGRHINFETLAPNPRRGGRLQVTDNKHIYLTDN